MPTELFWWVGDVQFVFPAKRKIGSRAAHACQGQAQASLAGYDKAQHRNLSRLDATSQESQILV